MGAEAFTNLLIGGAGAGRGYLDEKKRREQLAMEQRRLVMQEQAAQAETALRQAQYESDKAFKESQMKHQTLEDKAMYGDEADFVPGGLKKYGTDAVGGRMEDTRQFLLDHPEFETGTSRMTPRDKQPYNPYTKYSPLGGGASGGGGIDPMDIAGFRLKFLQGITQRPQGVIPPPMSIMAQQSDSLAHALGLDPLLKGELSFPEKTKGNVRTATGGNGKPPVMTQANALQKQMIDLVNSSTDDPATLMQELEADVKANPERFKGVDLNAVRAAISAKRRR